MCDFCKKYFKNSAILFINLPSSSSSASNISAQQIEYIINDKNPKGNPKSTAVKTGFPFHISAKEVRASKYVL